MFRPFTGQTPAEANSSNSVLLGFSELLRKFYTAEVYSEAAKMLRRVLLTLVEGEYDSLKVILPGRALGSFP